MASMFIRHRIGDFATWKAVFDELESYRRQHGVAGHSVHRDADDPSVIIVALRVADVARAKAFVQSESLRSAMERAGVQGAADVWFADDLEDKRY